MPNLSELDATHTPGPWRLLAVGEGTPRMCPADASLVSILTIVEEDGADFAAVYSDADARLIAAAPDHALIIRAMCVGDGRWEPFGDGRGEFCMNGLRHSTELDEFGCPRMTDAMRHAISKAIGEPHA